MAVIRMSKSSVMVIAKRLKKYLRIAILFGMKGKS